MGIKQEEKEKQVAVEDNEVSLMWCKHQNLWRWEINFSASETLKTEQQAVVFDLMVVFQNPEKCDFFYLSLFDYFMPKTTQMRSQIPSARGVSETFAVMCLLL